MLSQGYPDTSPAPSPRPRLRQQATHTLLPAPTPPAPSQEDTRIPRRRPPPHPRLRRSSPAPGGGGVRAWRYLVGSRIRLFSRISPCCGRVDIATGDGGSRGGGTRSPSPVSNAPTILLPVDPTPAFGRGPVYLAGSPLSSCAFVSGYPDTSLAAPSPPAPSQGYPCTFAGLPHPTRACGKGYPYPSAGTPTPPAPAALLPRPHRGGVRAWRYQGSNRIRLFSRVSPCCGPWGYRHGGWGRRGGGTCSPSPVSHTPTILLLAGIPCPRLRQRIPVHFCRHPRPLPAGKGQCRGAYPIDIAARGRGRPAPRQDYPFPPARVFFHEDNHAE